MLRGSIASFILADRFFFWTVRHHWDQHELRMFEKTKGVSDTDLKGWDLKEDLVAVRVLSRLQLEVHSPRMIVTTIFLAGKIGYHDIRNRFARQDSSAFTGKRLHPCSVSIFEINFSSSPTVTPMLSTHIPQCA